MIISSINWPFFQVVYELLKSGYQNLAAKNGDGQTAVHLAVYYGHLTILELLIKHKASTNSADLSGYTPLHMVGQSRVSH